jgi:hypothetical protein
VPADYYTCTAVMLWVDTEVQDIWAPFIYSNFSAAQLPYTTPRSLACASHDCSCSAPSLPPDMNDSNFVSTITIDGHVWDLPGPSLTIGLTAAFNEPDWLSNKSFEDRDPQNASEFWSGTLAYSSDTMNSLRNLDFGDPKYMYMYNDTLVERATIISKGQCIAEDAYSWGFSSPLLEIFWLYSIAVALALILLQTDVYWNSRHDRDHQSHSIYTDVLYLAEELKNTFGRDVQDHVQSPKAFDKKVGGWKQGLRLDVGELPLSRWQEWRLSRATKRANRKAKLTPATIRDPTLELRNLTSRNCGVSAISDTMYHGLVGAEGAASSFEAIFRSERRSISGEQAPPLRDMQKSSEESGSERSVSENAAQENADYRERIPLN